MEVIVASVNAEQQTGFVFRSINLAPIIFISFVFFYRDVIITNRLTLRPNSALVLESNFLKWLGCSKT